MRSTGEQKEGCKGGVSDALFSIFEWQEYSTTGGHGSGKGKAQTEKCLKKRKEK